MTERYSADFDKTSKDYATHRAGFPSRLFDELRDRGLGVPGQTILDIGTGTGTLARGFAARGAIVTGIDIAPSMLESARELAEAEGVMVDFRVASATETRAPDRSADMICAGQCWHWFDGPEAFAEAQRVLKPGGALLICHFDWLPLAGNVVEATEALIQNYSPDWPMGGGSGLYPQWLTGMAEAGFAGIETFSFDVAQPYSHLDWRGRIRASAGVGGSLPPDRVVAFDQALSDILKARFPAQPLMVPHRCWAVIGGAP